MAQALYQRIAESLKQRILTGGHPAGDVMPSENELADAYRTSRVTVRKAFQILESEGLIMARQGKGYIVQPPQHAVYTMVFGEAAEPFRFLEITIVNPDLEVSRALGLRDGQVVVVLRRLLERNGKPVAYDEKFVPYVRGTPTVELEMRYAEFPDMFAAHYTPASLRTEMEIRATTPPKRALLALGEENGRFLTVIRRILTADDTCIGFGREYLTNDYGPLRAGSGFDAKK